jgi:hypothetical protein
MLDENEVSHDESSNTEYYLAGPLAAFTTAFSDSQRNTTELGRFDIKTFQQRLSLLWTTLWKVDWSGGSIIGVSGTRAPEKTRYGALKVAPNGTFDTVQGLKIETVMNTTSYIVYSLPSVYAIDHAWLTIDFVSVGIMFLAAISSLVMHLMCRAPMLLGYVSSLIRDSSYFKDVYNNSPEDGTQNTRRLGGM